MLHFRRKRLVWNDPGNLTYPLLEWQELENITYAGGTLFTAFLTPHRGLRAGTDLQKAREAWAEQQFTPPHSLVPHESKLPNRPCLHKPGSWWEPQLMTSAGLPLALSFSNLITTMAKTNAKDFCTLKNIQESKARKQGLNLLYSHMKSLLWMKIQNLCILMIYFYQRKIFSASPSFSYSSLETWNVTIHSTSIA